MTYTPPIKFYYCPACRMYFTCHQLSGVDPIASGMVNCVCCSMPVSTKTVTYLDVVVEIGRIHEMASRVSELLAIDVELTGRRVGDFTVDELLNLLRTRRDDIHHALKGATAVDRGVVS